MTQTHDTIRKDSELGPIPQEWEVCRLGDLIHVRRGASPRPIIDYMAETGIPWVKISDATASNTRYIDSTKEYIKNEGAIHSVAVDKGDLILSNSATPGLPKFMNIKACIHDGRLLISEFKNINKDYLYYFFIKFREELAASGNGSVFQNLKTDIIRAIPIPLPPLSEQQAIASILGSLDDKIEVLREQNRTLEKMGQTMFYEWFGKYSIEDELPEGWRVGKLGDIVEIVNGYSYKGSELVEESNYSLVTLKSFDRNGGFQVRGFKPFIGTPKESQQVVIGDLVVAHTDLTQDAEVIGNPAFIFDDGGFEKLYITMDLVKVVTRDKNITNSFLYYLMKSDSFKGHCIGYTSGTTVLHLSKKAIPDYDIVLPQDLTLVKQFSDNASIITDKISANVYEIKSLTQSRDSLLPKLMSGKVRVF